MSRLVVTATSAGSVDNPVMLVSVSAANDGTPVLKLQTKHFKVYYLAASYSKSGQVLELMSASPVTKAAEGPSGFYILSLSPPLKSYQQVPAPGHHFMVAVTSLQGDQGQTQVVYAGS